MTLRNSSPLMVLFVLPAITGCPKHERDKLRFEVCDYEDNDGDEKIDEGFGLGEGCDAPEQAGSGVLDCAGPFAVRCRVEDPATPSDAPSAARDPAEAGLPLELCDGKDNDGDALSDEGFDLGASCSGECGLGELVCAGPFAVRCRSEKRASAELCDGKDNDCDGQIDEGYDVGKSCTGEAECLGKTACAADGGAACVAKASAEICDGLDNDCDGFVDLATVGASVVDACACVERRFSFGWSPQSASNPLASCAGRPTTCLRVNDELTMNFCLDFSVMPAPYALCVSAERMDLRPISGGGGDHALTVRFTFRSATPANARVNLYYHIDRSTAPMMNTSVRRYLPLLGHGDVPGTYTKAFQPKHTCYLNDSVTKCGGIQTDCKGCRAGDTCGATQGADCGALSFEAAQLQVAVEDVQAGKNSFEGELVIHEVFWGPLACEEP